jgi:4-hydroxy-tetrahydrodipicolinate synthase
MQLIPLIRALFIETNPIPVKTALAIMGKCKGDLRLPLTPMAEGNVKMLRQAMTDAGLVVN